mmetsp:Transcript_9098/g.26016  ORF Transcript_9098/g.26016 Transcript_9098/m.26016 type:complete len:283 (-) Transcript_9098:185-1033(-)
MVQVFDQALQELPPQHFLFGRLVLGEVQEEVVADVEHFLADALDRRGLSGLLLLLPPEDVESIQDLLRASPHLLLPHFHLEPLLLGIKRELIFDALLRTVRLVGEHLEGQAAHLVLGEEIMHNLERGERQKDTDNVVHHFQTLLVLGVQQPSEQGHEGVVLDEELQVAHVLAELHDEPRPADLVAVVLVRVVHHLHVIVQVVHVGLWQSSTQFAVRGRAISSASTVHGPFSQKPALELNECSLHSAHFRRGDLFALVHDLIRHRLNVSSRGERRHAYLLGLA